MFHPDTINIKLLTFQNPEKHNKHPLLTGGRVQHYKYPDLVEKILIKKEYFGSEDN